MIVTCDKCFTRYVVNSIISAQGRTVKCAKCGHSWLQKPDAIPDVGNIREGISSSNARPVTVSSTLLKTAGLSAIPPDDNLPVIRVARTSPTPFWIKLLPLITLLLFVMLAIVLYKDTVLRTMPELQPLYNMIGLYDTEGITLREIILSKEKEGIYLHGKIVNTSTEMRYLPAIHIAILDEEKRPFASYLLTSPTSLLESSATYDIYNKLPDNIGEAAYITVDTGNKAELMLRGVFLQ